MDEIRSNIDERGICITAIISLLPEPYKSILTDYDFTDQMDRTEARNWLFKKVPKILEQMSRVRDDYPSERTETVECPLCKDKGWKYPEGLRRHLTGEMGASECSVMRSLWVFRRDYIIYFNESKRR